MKLHIGGVHPHPEWTIVNAQAGQEEQITCDARDIPVEAGMASEIYASHIVEHFDYARDLRTVLAEWYRVLAPGGLLRVSVPDLPTLCELYLQGNLALRHHLMRVIYGGHTDPYDYHYVGFDEELLAAYLLDAGFEAVERVERFGLFEDCSGIEIADRLISLNVQCRKPI